MPQRGDIQINNFVKGLITEASPLTFPPGASLDEINFELLRDGSRMRRLGLDLEENYGLNNTGFTSDVLEGARCQAYRWSIPNGDIEQDIGVIQIGNRIYFIDLYTQNPSANILNGGNPIVAAELNNDVIMTFTTINNYLIGVANHLLQPYLFTYDAETDSVTIETSAILVRDMWGVDDGLGVDERPTILSAKHHYNLLNQGWLPNVESTCGAGVNGIDCTFNTFGVYPSNSDQWSIGRIEDLTSADVKKFDPNIAARNLVNNGQVARGHFILGLYNRGVSRSIQTGLTLPIDREDGRINAIASYAGRVFYAGILSKIVGGDNRSPNLSGTVLFSQLFENKLNLVKCHQEADPTSPDINDIVDTDGGIIQIPECSYIYVLKPIKESLFVFAANGVWEIRGDEGGFRATSFQVNKISNVGVYAPKSIIEVEGVIYFWSATGIHAIARNENGVFQTTNITIPTIQKFYNAIPDASKKNARGYFDLAQNRARWLYYSPETKVLGNPIDCDEVPPQPFFSVTAGVTITRNFVSHFGLLGYSDDRVLSIQLETIASNLLRSSIVDTTDITTSYINTVTLTNAPDVLNDSTDIDDEIIKFDDNTILSAWSDDGGGELRMVASTLSGTTYTSGTVVNAYPTAIATAAHRIRIIKLTESKIICVFYDPSRPAGQELKAVIVTRSGTTLTVGAVFDITATGAQQYDVAKISEASVLLIWRDGTLAECSKLLSISGTTITESATHQITGFTAEPMFSPVIHLKTSSLGYLHYYGEGKNRVRVFTLSGHQVSVSPYLEISTNTLNSADRFSSILIGDTLVSTYITLSPRNTYLNISNLFTPPSNQSITPKYDASIDPSTTSGRTKIVPYGNNNYMIATRSTSNVLKFYTYKITF